MRTTAQTLLRTAAERSSHRLVLRRRLPKPFDEAVIYATSEGGLRYLRPSLKQVDPPLLRLVSDLVRPGQTVWDIGANVGIFSLAAAVAAGPAGRVLAVEPDAALVKLLRRSASSNTRCAPIDVLPSAIARDLGVAKFNIGRRNRSTSHLSGFGTTQTGGIRLTELVPTVTLDWLAKFFQPPDLLKIDVEAAEVEVLSGGNCVLSGRPTVICEVARDNVSAVTEILVSHEYMIFDGDLPKDLRVPISSACANTLATTIRTADSAVRSEGCYG